MGLIYIFSSTVMYFNRPVIICALSDCQAFKRVSISAHLSVNLFQDVDDLYFASIGDTS